MATCFPYSHHYICFSVICHLFWPTKILQSIVFGPSQGGIEFHGSMIKTWNQQSHCSWAALMTSQSHLNRWYSCVSDDFGCSNRNEPPLQTQSAMSNTHLVWQLGNMPVMDENDVMTLADHIQALREYPDIRIICPQCPVEHNCQTTCSRDTVNHLFEKTDPGHHCVRPVNVCSGEISFWK